MLLNGKLFATSDVNFVQQALMSGSRVIYLGDPISIDPALKDHVVISTPLTPDYQTLSLFVDGNIDGFTNMYISSLNSKAAIEIFAVIFVCLYKGINIVLFVPPEASGLNFIEYLLGFIQVHYGITTQTTSTMFNFDQSFSTRIAELMYLENLINCQEFLVNSETLDQVTLKKLVNELHPMVKDPTDINQIVKWFSNYKDQLLSNMNLVNGIQYAGEVSDYACY